MILPIVRGPIVTANTTSKMVTWSSPYFFRPSCPKYRNLSLQTFIVPRRELSLHCQKVTRHRNVFSEVLTAVTEK
jgi:hypothetical protein